MSLTEKKWTKKKKTMSEKKQQSDYHSDKPTSSLHRHPLPHHCWKPNMFSRFESVDKPVLGLRNGPQEKNKEGRLPVENRESKIL